MIDFFRFLLFSEVLKFCWNKAFSWEFTTCDTFFMQESERIFRLNSGELLALALNFSQIWKFGYSLQKCIARKLLVIEKKISSGSLKYESVESANAMKKIKYVIRSALNFLRCLRSCIYRKKKLFSFLSKKRYTLRVSLMGGGRNFERSHVERPIFRNLKIGGGGSKFGTVKC